MNLDDRPRNRYYLSVNGQPETEVTREEYIKAERAHGFMSRPDMLATLAWTSGADSGRVEVGQP